VRENYKGFPDEEIVKIAVEEGRTIITYDLGFSELYRNFGASSIILRLHSKKSSYVIDHLLRFLNQIKESNTDLKNKLAVITEARVRIVG
jgi:predicted nuclease of predicted toxin-antitoxin system